MTMHPELVDEHGHHGTCVDLAKVEAIAEACHEAAGAWSRAHGDYSQKRWHAAPESQRESMRMNVLFALSHPGQIETSAAPAFQQAKDRMFRAIVQALR